MRPENGNTTEAEFYTPDEFRALLETAAAAEPESIDANLLPMLAIGGIAGLRTAELLRLTWEDTRRTEGHIVVTAGKSKTRQRRLVEIVPAMARWPAPFAELTGRIWAGHEVTFQQHFGKDCDQAGYKSKTGHKVIVKRKANGLRHAFCTYHFAAHNNENLTAQQAGNSPAMIHAHDKGLATKTEAEKWFAVAPLSKENVIPLAASK